LVMIAISIATVVPFLFMLSTAFAHSTTMMSLPPRFWPKEPTLDNFSNIIFQFEGGLFPRWFLNTVFTTAAITVGGLILNTLSGYIFAKKQFYGRDLVFAIILATLMVPNAVTLIPAFLIVNKLKLFNTYWALIIPALSSAFGIFMMRQYISSL